MDVSMGPDNRLFHGCRFVERDNRFFMVTERDSAAAIIRANLKDIMESRSIMIGEEATVTGKAPAWIYASVAANLKLYFNVIYYKDHNGVIGIS